VIGSAIAVNAVAGIKRSLSAVLIQTGRRISSRAANLNGELMPNAIICFCPEDLSRMS